MVNEDSMNGLDVGEAPQYIGVARRVEFKLFYLFILKKKMIVEILLRQ